MPIRLQCRHRNHRRHLPAATERADAAKEIEVGTSLASSELELTTATQNAMLSVLPPENRERRKRHLDGLRRREFDRIVNAYNNSGRTANKIRKFEQKKKISRTVLTGVVLDLFADMPGSNRQWLLHRYVVKAVLARSGPQTRDSKIGKKGEYTYDVE